MNSVRKLKIVLSKMRVDPLRKRIERVAAVSQILVQDISKHWDSAKAVDNVSFEASAASLLVLLGPSGCGKSTTLRLIAGLEQVSSGRILIGGQDVTNLPPAKRHISMVFQSYALFPHLSVAENILVWLEGAQSTGGRTVASAWARRIAARS